jgi:predicted phage baseplate assembly protein
MARGRLVPPNLDDRTWQELVDQARALIPTYAPAWTDHNPSDLGVTLIELFAWLVEGLIYRLNRVPDKSLLEFLNLMGVTRDPATPASTYVTYQLATGAGPTVVPKSHQVATPQTENNQAVIFETDEDERLLPINMTTVLYLRQDSSNRLRCSDVTSQQGSGLTPFSIPGSGAGLVALGFDAATLEPITLRLRMSRPVRKNTVQLKWGYSVGATPPQVVGTNAAPDWTDAAVVNLTDGTNGLEKNGLVTFSIPADWSSQRPSAWPFQPEPGSSVPDKALFWVGLLITNKTTQPVLVELEHLLFNAAPATNALTVAEPELLGLSDGRPFQSFELLHQPVYKQVGKRDPYGHVRVQTRKPLVGGGFDTWTDWQRVEDFPRGAGAYFRLQPVTGTIIFGNHDAATSPDGHGTIPVSGSEIRVLTYRYVAGDARGNVPRGAITVIRKTLAGLNSVRNLVPATGGSDEETIEETRRRGPLVLRNRDRAVTVEDYEYLAREATTDVCKVRCLPERLFTSYDKLPPGAAVGDPWTYGGLYRGQGHVNVIIIPNAPLSNGTPVPDGELIDEVSDYLDVRRMLTTALHVTSPRYLPINVTAEVRVWRQAIDTGLIKDINQVKDDLTAKLRQFLHPIVGGPDGTGWEVGKDIVLSSLLEFIQVDAAIGFISSLSLAAGGALYEPATRPSVVSSSVWVQLADYEIICSGQHTVNVRQQDT